MVPYMSIWSRGSNIRLRIWSCWLRACSHWSRRIPVKAGIPGYTARVGSPVVCMTSAYPNHAQHAADGISEPQPDQQWHTTDTRIDETGRRSYSLLCCSVAIRQYAYRHKSLHEYGVSWHEILGLIRTTALAFCPTRLTWPNDLHALFSILISRLFPALHMHSTTLFGVSWLSACTSPERWTITRQPTPWMLITTSYSVFTTS